MSKLVSIALFLPLVAHAAQVIGISDGDTLTVLQDRQPVKIRLADIDAPEKAQPFGQRSRQSLSELCYGKDAELQVRNKDRYGRTVARVICGGVDANRVQVERGMAWHYTRYSRDPELRAVEREAREAGRGLWADPLPVPRWEWRRKKLRYNAPDSPIIPARELDPNKKRQKYGSVRVLLQIIRSRFAGTKVRRFKNGIIP